MCGPHLAPASNTLNCHWEGRRLQPLCEGLGAPAISCDTKGAHDATRSAVFRTELHALSVELLHLKRSELDPVEAPRVDRDHLRSIRSNTVRERCDAARRAED